MKQLEQLEQGLIESAKAKQVAIDLATEASVDFNDELARVMLDNPQLRKYQDINIAAQEMAKVHKDHYDETKVNAVKELLTLTDPEDMADIDAFGYRLEKKVALSNDPTMVEQLVKMGFVIKLFIQG